HTNRLFVIARGEIPPADEPHTERLEITGAGHRASALGSLAGLRTRLAFDEDWSRHDMRVSGNKVPDAGSLYTGQGSHFVQKLTLEQQPSAAVITLQVKVG